ncbi:MAG: hypothetical protein LBJ46_08665 [Planctomycetota bacterium]|jgi:Fe-S-cluster containining protein|nr:hypothetical protein [Planctomycetota bacterium]
MRALARFKGGTCVFLAEDGCRLDEETRPLICRLYPLEYDDRCIKGVSPGLCSSPERDNPVLLLARLGMNRDQAESWRKTLYREIAEEFGVDGIVVE